MDNRAEVREFLTSRRAKITPERAHVPQAGRRRVPGLRRGEVAALAGVSVEYYTKLERGALGGVSAGVLDALARALQLDDAERAHLFHLAQAADGTTAAMRPRRREPRSPAVRPSLRWALDAITTGPAIVANSRSDLVAANLLGRALYTDVYTGGVPNLIRFTFLDAAAHRLYPQWAHAADMCVANLRTAVGCDPFDRALQELVGELSTRSDEFRRRWGSHDVRIHGGGVKTFHHHVVGDLSLAYESLDLQAEPGHVLTIFSAEPGTPHADALALLASWAVTHETSDRPQRTEIH
ncbi:helix-turn-helix transcriptional regulator [Catenuloplanes japonicus]|uniref:helix-turn-helix transcriptional regulator n=1 Tax=Catenuloplanes japonicus TaxID=33876 RepID=UPI0005275F13|nr:helix-turn-helix transcriptional regulator [Catenuloplanes japonicus]